MPPWPPSSRSPAYVGQAQRTLDARERETLVRWARSQLVRPGARTARHARRRAQRRLHGAAGRRVAARARDAGRVPAGRGQRRDRRLPVLPPRPEARERRVRDLGADRAGRDLARAPRDPLPHRRRAPSPRRTRSTVALGRAGLDVLRRPRGRRWDERKPARAARRRRLDRRLGARLGLRPPPGGHGRLAPGGQPDRDAGALQPAERPAARSLARGAHDGAGDDRADARADDAPPRPRRARLPPGRDRPPLRPHGGGLRPGRALRHRLGARLLGTAPALRQERGAARRRRRSRRATARSAAR